MIRGKHFSCKMEKLVALFDQWVKKKKGLDFCSQSKVVTILRLTLTWILLIAKPKELVTFESEYPCKFKPST